MKTIVQEIKDIIEDARQIESATGYGPDYLYHHNCCDSTVHVEDNFANITAGFSFTQNGTYHTALGNNPES